jgi:alcohol dehydrogenase YqhD (iron-dependent ADH family)
MKQFEFYNPVRIIFGAGTFDALGAETARLGKKALLVKAEGPLEKLGVYARATKSMEAAGVHVVPLEGVAANPKLSSVRDGIRMAKEEKADVIIAVGGGSVIDCAKAIAVGAVHDGDVWDFFTGRRPAPEKALPIGAVSTLAATGAEMSLHCVITNAETNQKYASHFGVNYPRFSIIDPVLHTTVPRFITACGLCDTITHSAENYFVGDRNTPMTDRIAEGVVLTVLENEGILDNLKDVEMRANLAWAAAISINGLTDCGRGIFYYGAHTIEHALSAFYDVAHGAGLSVVHPAWLDYVCDQEPARFAHFAERVFGMTRAGKSDRVLGKAGIAALKAKYKAWGLPVTLAELGIKDTSKLEAMAAGIIVDPDSGIKDTAIVFDVLKRCT